MNILTIDMINVFFKLLVEASNNNNERDERIYFYKFQGMIEGLYYADILSDEEYGFLIDAAWEVYF